MNSDLINPVTEKENEPVEYLEGPDPGDETPGVDHTEELRLILIADLRI